MGHEYNKWIHSQCMLHTVMPNYGRFLASVEMYTIFPYSITLDHLAILTPFLRGNLIALTLSISSPPNLRLSIVHHHTRPGALISLLNSATSTILFLGVPFPAAILLARPLRCRICSKASSRLMPPGVAGAGVKGGSSFRGTVTVFV